MLKVSDLCKPRDNVFQDTTKDDVLNLSDFVDGKIDVDKFFGENFTTKGMEMLFEIAFKRFQSKSDTGVIKLTQAMGGGKTHNMLALALLAKNKVWRSKLLGKSFDDISDIKVVAFSGRESDAPYGIWGSIAEQLGKSELFKDLYTPLKAPGESAWVNMLKGQNLLLLFDELPPYLENAKSITIGNSDLCKVTITALSNLFTAVGKSQLSNVCIVFSDLKATYESGSELLQSSFKELENEANRSAINIEPVALNSDEIYEILKKRLFIKYPTTNQMEVNDIAIGYKESLEKAGKSGLTNYTAEKIYIGIKDSYPFHPSIKDLYARFKENPNFQQTRGLIKLMRQIVRKFFDSGKANQKSLINVFDIDLSDRNMLSHIKQIKTSLEAAVSHDIAQDGKAIAEIIDAQYKGTEYAQNVAKLLFMSSLDSSMHGILGLTDSEALGYLCEPNVDLNEYKKALDELKTQCWYLKLDNRGRHYFQEKKNMVAEMNTLVESYSNEQAKKDLRKFLQDNFAPKIKNCYEKLYVLPAIDEIEISVNEISLVIFEPYTGMGLHPDLKAYYDNVAYKNRIMFLSGQRSMMEKLYQNSKKLTAIAHIISNMKAEHVSETDQQWKEADNQKDKATAVLLQTIRETFRTLYYPSKSGLECEDFKLEFKENSFKGEEQIVNTLKQVQKFEDYSSDEKALEIIQKKCESRLFTQKEMQWRHILERAATENGWQWYNPKQAEDFKKHMLKTDRWRETAGYLVKGPFAKDPTDVAVEQLSYDEKTAQFTLKVRPIHGDTVYYDIGAEPSEASTKVTNPFVTKEPQLYFLCVDSSKDNPHPRGKALKFTCSVPLKYEQRLSPNGKVLEFKTHKNFEIRYTTDGSSPENNGGTYIGEIMLPQNCKYVRAVVKYKGEVIESKDITISDTITRTPPPIDDAKPLEFILREPIKCKDTEETYREFQKLNSFNNTFLRHFTVTISEKQNNQNYMQLTTSTVPYDSSNLQATVDFIRNSGFCNKDVIIDFEYKTILFMSGSLFKQWIIINKIDLNDLRKVGEIKQ